MHIYENVCGELKERSLFQNVDIVIFTSPSTVKNMIKMVGLDVIKEKKSLAIGPITAKELEDSGIKNLVCSEYSEEGIINKLVEIAEKD